MLTRLKKEEEFSWLNDVSSVPLQQTLRHQHAAFQGFFTKRANYPRFKNKRSNSSATYVGKGFTFRNGRIKLAKMKDPLDIRWSRGLPEGVSPSSVTISKDKSNRYFISILVEEVIPQLPTVNKSVGIDLGVTVAVVTSEGDTFHPDLKAARRKVIKCQKNLSRKSKGSKRRNKARLKLARAHAHLADKRRDFLHKTTTTLIRENQTIVVEDLNVKGMTSSAKGTLDSPGKNVKQKAGLNRSILNHSFGEFRTMLEYKADWYGREVIVVDRFYPSSKVCSECGHLMTQMPLRVRLWTCPACHAEHDRDINAAKNLAAFALGHREKKNARGGPVRPMDFSSSARLNETRTNQVASARGNPRP